MEMSAAIRKVLEAATINAQPEAVAGTESGARLRMVLLGDDQGNIQAITRRDDLLDLVDLNKQLGRDLHLVSQTEYARLRRETGLREIPALPGLTGWPTLVDDRARSADMVVIEPAGDNACLRLNQEQFGGLIHGADLRSFCVPLSSVDVNLGAPEKDGEQLKSAIQKFTGLRIRQRLEDTLELPPLPETAQRIIHLRVNPNAAMGDLVDIVESDPSLAAQVVSWASSSFYAAAGQVRSVHDAVSRVLGFDLVMNLAMGLSLGKTLNQPSDHPRGFVGYWQQAIWEAQAAGILAGMMPRGQRPTFGLAYLGGLLHNFGYLVLAQVFPPHFKLACRHWEVNDHVDTSLIEHYLLGVTREQLASELMANWGMPDEVIVAIRHQKNLTYSGPLEVYPKLLWLGRQLLNERGLNLGPRKVIPETLYIHLGLDPDQVAEQFDDLVASKDSVVAMAGMMSQA
ncbi:HD-like signal output (HDOD) domain, no enzymatic activity [Marinobacter daqiaonensis]|uniref:HD-like signal output (HDOD) domain, no enzymatic activity n=1 Tax=Marinobacter daqiaonensis TaxID=650891 RepID=A0A1I6JVS0_9GAMM|nr:HDOD domain-containing protein [Marinobacter daqiaonensis]SFR83036.1 HD-like signal output (HDOD) domain, no enzymatic activity [Marinobacter daqiaonensis]